MIVLLYPRPEMGRIFAYWFSSHLAQFFFWFLLLITKQSRWPFLVHGQLWEMHRSFVMVQPLIRTSSIVVENPFLVARHSTFQRRAVAEKKRRTHFNATKLLIIGQLVRQPLMKFFIFSISFKCRHTCMVNSSAISVVDVRGLAFTLPLIYRCQPLIVDRVSSDVQDPCVDGSICFHSTTAEFELVKQGEWSSRFDSIFASDILRCLARAMQAPAY